MVRNPPPKAGDKRARFDLWARKKPWGGGMQLTPIFLPGESHGQRSLAGYSSWGHKALDTTEQLSTANTILNFL